MTRMALVLVAAAAFAAFPARVGAQRTPKDNRSWRAPHVALASGFGVALWIDLAQTREAMRRGYRESNPLLGPHPSIARLNIYTAVAGATVLGAAAALPARLRPWLLGAALAVEMFAIARTVRLGVAIQFP